MLLSVHIIVLVLFGRKKGAVAKVKLQQPLSVLGDTGLALQSETSCFLLPGRLRP